MVSGDRLLAVGRESIRRHHVHELHHAAVFVRQDVAEGELRAAGYMVLVALVLFLVGVATIVIGAIRFNK